MSFQDALKEVMIRRKLTDTQIADKFDCAPITVRSWKCGRIEPSPGTQKYILDKLETL